MSLSALQIYYLFHDVKNHSISSQFQYFLIHFHYKRPSTHFHHLLMATRQIILPEVLEYRKSSLFKIMQTFI